MTRKIISPEYHCKSWFCRAFSHWLNPLGNWNEPLPYPEKRAIQASESWMPDSVWWNLRNPFHNFNHYWIGITPLGNRYEWLEPSDNGWVRESDAVVGEHYHISYWTRGRIKLPIFKWKNYGWEFYVGWMDRGNFGIAFRRD